MNYREIDRCRISGDSNLIPVIDLGAQYLTGVFPRSTEESITNGPLQLVWNAKSSLLQLRHSYDLSEMYGDNYGYRSGLNKSMVAHLTEKINLLESEFKLSSGDIVLDIGSNDATTLQSYKTKDLVKIGIDPTSEKFSEYYSSDIIRVPDFFTQNAYFNKLNKPAKIITSIAMFYDLEDPLSFVKDIAECLDTDGVWHFEQSYVTSMLRTNSYDTICHEHLEYYSISNICQLLDSVNMHVLDISFNNVNGGSFSITASKKNSKYNQNHRLINWYLNQEKRLNLSSPKVYRDFEDRAYYHRKELLDLLNLLKSQGKSIAGYGASTKGNVILQFCGIDSSLLEYVVDINPLKDGCYTPGTNIKIVSDEYMHANLPDYFLVLPWHFKDNILTREIELRKRGVKFILPLPKIEIV